MNNEKLQRAPEALNLNDAANQRARNLINDTNQRARHNAIKLLTEQAGLSTVEAQELVNETIHRIPALNTTMKPYVQGVIRWYVDGYVDLADAASCSKISTLLTVLSNSPALDAVYRDFYCELTNEILTPDTLKELLAVDDVITEEEFYFDASDYKLLHITSWADIQAYRDLCPDWCIVNSEDAWNTYSCSGNNKVFLALHKDYKQTARTPGPEHPYDKYGYSIICIILDAYDDVSSTTSRWNATIEGDAFLSIAQAKSLLKR
jgi:hypothetical protein